MPSYLRTAVSNGHPRQQQLIRQWWHEIHGARGCLVWEYYLSGCYLDAVWFQEAGGIGVECPGLHAARKFPMGGASVVLCEAKLRLTPELVGQALVYGAFARRLGAQVQSIVIFAESGAEAIRNAAEDLGLEVVMREAT